MPDGWPEHPLMPPPSIEAVKVLASRRGLSNRDALTLLVEQAHDAVEKEAHDPLRFGWEPQIWKVCDALLDFPWCDDVLFLEHIRARFDMDWDQWKAAMRKALGFPHRLTMLLIMGGIRSGKSEYAAKRSQMMLTHRSGSRVYAFHMSYDRSVQEQQVLFWKYMPAEWRRGKIKGGEFAISYNAKRGFSESSFINPLEGFCAFRNYSQEMNTALQGIEPDVACPDELVPVEWLEFIMDRLANREGYGIATFTPVDGYTPSVQLFNDGAQRVREIPGFMLPRDGGDALPWLQLGLEESQWDELALAKEEKRPPKSLHCVPEDCCAWLEEGLAAPEEDDGVVRPFGYGQSLQPVPEDRLFEPMPRVLRSANSQLGVVNFCCDNPFGNPAEVVRTQLKKGREALRLSVYGMAERTAGSVFPKFSEKHHVLDDAVVPREGRNVMLADPASDRNFSYLWLRDTGEGVYVYREWPGSYWIPGVGVPEAWAVPTGKNKGKNDGKRGGAQKAFGWGLLQYKREWARLEGWVDYWRWMESVGCAVMWDAELPEDEAAEAWLRWGCVPRCRPEDAVWREYLDGALVPENDTVLGWRSHAGSDALWTPERQDWRIIDSRAASSPRVERDRPVTLQSELEDVGVWFDLAPGAGIADGTAPINGALLFDLDAEGSFFNKPKLHIARSCRNVQFALAYYMGVDGQKGACKEWIDLLRYYYTHECSKGSVAPPRSGGSYGRRNGGGNRIGPPKRKGPRRARRRC